MIGLAHPNREDLPGIEFDIGDHFGVATHRVMVAVKNADPVFSTHIL